MTHWELLKMAWATGPIYPKLSLGFIVLLFVGLCVFVAFEDKFDL
jgi:hypothetical protein